MNKIDQDVEQRILAFFNQATNPSQIVNRIQGDPRCGKPSRRAYGIRPSLAKRILEIRDSLPEKKFKSFEQIDAVQGVGRHTRQNIIYSFMLPTNISAARLYAEGHVDLAEAELKHENTPQALFTLGRLHESQGRSEDAEQAYNQANSPIARQHLGRLHYRQGRLEEAENALKEAKTPQALTSLGLMYARQARLDEAEETWKQADTARSLYYLALHFCHRNDPEQAINCFEKAVLKDNTYLSLVLDDEISSCIRELPGFNEVVTRLSNN